MSRAGSPISFRTHVARLPQKGLPVRFEADERQRAALADEHGLLSVGRLCVDLLVQRWRGDGVRVSGRVEADIVQPCVVTLDPVPATIDEPVDALFVPEGSRLARFAADPSGEMVLDAEGPDAPETFGGDAIDVGALAEEFFGLAIPPYPRSAGAHATLEGVKPVDEPAEVSPFARLAELRRRD